ncbi:low molecular weight protein-tyrosine-phosphatase [Ideonella sp.]|uniref:low molecular weight protein-tyrosine-phosphatase n=1 Tax=Ideonella sp. TaxID=1929293 RepID=UPI002B46596C|nr:low molecular weight protein-tyrosine-phosphatase [Ideonella sp.]HJV70023.1 low molecular weight protein-tyrosine-phosphatase [Ideonella sp.]
MTSGEKPVRVLMVCTGNICRSPTAEAVLRAKAMAAGLVERLVVDSAGVSDYHVGDPPDRRAQAHARRRGYDLSTLRARQVHDGDFQHFDWLLAMDEGHLRDLQGQAPTNHTARLARLLDFAPGREGLDVPDPYYGAAAGFEQVLDLVEAGCDGLLHRLFGYTTR